MAFYSIQRAVSDGSLVLLPLSVEYFDRTEITVFFDDLPTELGVDWNWVGSTDTSISFPIAVADGVEVKVVRTTDISLVRHVFVDGAAFLDETLDENYKQMLHIAQEARERAVGADMFNDMNMHGYHITNLGTATDPNHAISLAQYQADASGAWTARNQAVAAKDAALASQIAAETAETNAETAAASAGTSASSASSSASSAAASASAASTSATSANSSAASASLDADAAAASASSASTDADSANAAAALASASEIDAESAAVAAANSEASASSSATSASSSASIATVKAGEAAASASSASTSAASASTSAASANTSKVAAENAALSVNSKLDEFVNLQYLQDFGLITDTAGTTTDYGALV